MTHPFGSPLPKVGIELIARNQTNMNVNVLLLMTIMGAIAAIGIATNALPERDRVSRLQFLPAVFHQNPAPQKLKAGTHLCHYRL